jgi:hypothetical protein
MGEERPLWEHRFNVLVANDRLYCVLPSSTTKTLRRKWQRERGTLRRIKKWSAQRWKEIKLARIN